MYNFDPFNSFLVIATNIAVLLLTAFVLQHMLMQKRPLKCIYKEMHCYVSEHT